MKFTSEDLMKAMGLQVGDRIKISVANNNFIYEIRLNAENKPYLLNEQNLINCGDVHSLIDMDYEILPRPKRVGELDCFVEIKCNNCPLRMISGCTNSEGVPLYDILKEIQIDSTKNNMFDQEIYDLLKARLDKEVK